MIYLDNAATTKPSKAAIDAFLKASEITWSNPSSVHAFGEEAAFLLKKARENIKGYLEIKNGEIYFTSAATESINLFFMSALKPDDHIIISSYEHAAVYENARRFEEMGGHVSYIKPIDGTIRAIDVVDAIKPNTRMVAIMYVNNEIGAINPVKEIAKAVKMKNRDILFFVDGVQAVGKIKVDIDDINCNGFAVSAHKFHGMKGTGLLYLNGVSLKPQILGGGQEMGLRSGTENVAGILAMEAALKEAVEKLDVNRAKVTHLRETFLDGLKDLDGYKINTPENSVPHILSISFEKSKGEVLVHMLEEDEIYVNTSSACGKIGHKKSRTLTSLGLSDDLINGTIRFSFQDDDRVEDMVFASEKVIKAVERIREII
ncbi:MAG: cysteine desulfurase [Ezakiella sp.]|nr:cysteine desulfurase [Ezakiella sp.]